MDIFNLIPSKIILKNGILCKKIDSKTKIKNYSKKLSIFRNYYKNYFVDTKTVTIKSTEQYLANIKKNKNKNMYIIYLNKKIIGQYGFHQWENGYITLDGAMRFSNKGSRDLFYTIQKKILNLLSKKIPKCSPVIICHKKNLTALRLHNKFPFKDIKNKKKLKFFRNYIKSKTNKISRFYLKEYKN